MKYKYLWKPNHPNAYSNGCILEHRYVMSQNLGRPLKKGEWVHHINENPQDNRKENLELTTRQKHPKIHFTGKVAHNKGTHHTEKVRKKCGLINIGKHRSPNTEFKKGFTPWNKGTKGIMKPNSTSFKKGQIPWNKKSHN